MEMHGNEYVIEIYEWDVNYKMVMRIIDEIFIIKILLKIFKQVNSKIRQMIIK